MTSEDVDRFWRRVDFGDGDSCWPWLGCRRRGYGSFRVSGVSYGAHRIALYIGGGTWPGRLFALHSCDNPPCCNPSHLRIGTALQNARDASERGRIGGQRPGSFSQSQTADEIRAELFDAIAEIAESGEDVVRKGRLSDPIKLIAARHGVPSYMVYSCTASMRDAASRLPGYDEW